MSEIFALYGPYITGFFAAVGAAISWFFAQMMAVRKVENSERTELLDRIHQYSERQDDRLKERDDQIEKLTKALIEARFKIVEISKTNILLST